MKKTIFCALTAMAMTLVLSCGRPESSPVEIARLDLILRGDSVPSTSDVSDIAARWFAIAGYGELTDSAVAARASSRQLEPFYAPLDSVWTAERLAEVEAELGRVYDGLRRELGDTVALPRPVAIVSPFNQSVIVADSIVFIGLNHYLGADFPLYGYFPDWQRRDKRPERLAPNVAEAILRSRYPAGEVGNGALPQMLHEGALLEVLVRVCGDSALPWTPEQEAFLTDNEARMWEKMLSDRLVFSEDGGVVRSLLAPGAFSSVIAPEVPARAGAFIGRNIVRSRLKNHKVSASEMLSAEWANDADALREADYHP
ncbi:MAG: hypothetical protein K2G35_03365 [Duncaniella sp.]|nr:hypothetical protein [Duncaniella sp.]